MQEMLLFECLLLSLLTSVLYQRTDGLFMLINSELVLELLLRLAHTIYLPVSSLFWSPLLKTFWFTNPALLVFLTQACRYERLIKHAKRHLHCAPYGHELLINNNQETQQLTLFVLLMWEALLHPNTSVKLSVDNWMMTQPALVGVYVLSDYTYCWLLLCVSFGT